MDLLQRYTHGEYKQVWDEMISYGDQVREEPLFSETLAVARETMRRVRLNIEMLIPRLSAVGYQFGYGWIQPFIHERLHQPYLLRSAHFQTKIAEPHVPERFTFEYRSIYMERLEQAQAQPPLFLPATENEEHIHHLEQIIQQTNHPDSPYVVSLRQMQTQIRSKGKPLDLIARLEQAGGILPLSVRVWYEMVGAVNFVGYHPQWREILPGSETNSALDEYDYLCPLHVLDPLFVLPLDAQWVEDYCNQSNTQQQIRSLALSVDDGAKYLDGLRQLAQIPIPSLSVDVTIDLYAATFVDYLRTCFQWAGFPGWSHLPAFPERDLSFLTRDLLPF